MYSLPRLYHKLYTNTRLTSQEENQVRRARGETLIKLKAIESKTALLLGRLAILDQKSLGLEHYIDVRHRFISPIRRLVPEILQEIFWRCLPTAHNSLFSFREAPLLLGQVCSLWRQIAYSTPKLWSSLHIVVVPLSFPRAEARLEAFDAWLARSGILPLHISMATARPYLFMSGFQPYHDLIAKHARRLKSIYLQVDIHDPLNILTDLHACDLPSLERLYIYSNALVAGSTGTHSLLKKDGVLFAPLLHVLSVQDYSVRLLDLPVQWSQLTGLCFVPRASEVSDVFEFLPHCSNLETCFMNLGNSVDLAIPTPDNRRQVVLPKLRTLKIYGGLTPNHDSLIILSGLFTPALRHLAYEHLAWQHPTWMTVPFTEVSPSLEIFRSFFQRLNEPLEELDFVTDGLVARYVMELLSLCPGLKRLSLRFIVLSEKSAVDDSLLLGFIPYEHKRHCQSCSLVEEQGEELDSIIPSFRCLCPILEVLDVDDAVFSKHVLLEFLQSRLVDYDRHDFMRLRRFAIYFDLRLEDHDMAGEVDRLVEESGIVDMHLWRRPIIRFL